MTPFPARLRGRVPYLLMVAALSMMMAGCGPCEFLGIYSMTLFPLEPDGGGCRFRPERQVFQVIRSDSFPFATDIEGSITSQEIDGRSCVLDMELEQIDPSDPAGRRFFTLHIDLDSPTLMGTGVLKKIAGDFSCTEDLVIVGEKLGRRILGADAASDVGAGASAGG